MKAQINNENKRRLFCLYTDSLIHTDENGMTSLILKPLSQISDEDLTHVKNICQYKYEADAAGFVRTIIGKFFDKRNPPAYKTLESIDFLRSKGYALPWMGISVQEMIEAGWIKLTES